MSAAAGGPAAAGAGGGDDFQLPRPQPAARRGRGDDDDDERRNRRRAGLNAPADEARAAQAARLQERIQVIRQLFVQFRVEKGLDYYTALKVLLMAFDADLVALALSNLPESLAAPKGPGGKPAPGPY